MTEGPPRWRGAACVRHLRGGRRQQRKGRPGVAALGRRLHLLTWQAEAEVLACHAISPCMQPGVPGVHCNQQTPDKCCIWKPMTSAHTLPLGRCPCLLSWQSENQPPGGL